MNKPFHRLLFLLVFLGGAGAAHAVSDPLDLTLYKQLEWGGDTVFVGDQATFLITLQNTGQFGTDLQYLVFEEYLPTGMTYVSATDEDGADFACTAGDPITCQATASQMLGPGQSYGWYITVDVGPEAAGTVTNEVQLPYGVNGTSRTAVVWFDVKVLEPADLKVTKTLKTTGDLVAGENVVFTIKAENLGPYDQVKQVIVTDVPANMTFVGANSSGSCLEVVSPAGNVDCTYTSNTFVNGYSDEFDIEFMVDPDTDAITNNAFITLFEEDPDGTNNSTVADAALQSIPVTREFDLILSAVDDPDPVLAGSGAGNLTHKITLINSGPSEAPNVEVDIAPTLPGGVTLVSAVPNYGTMNGNTWELGNVAPESPVRELVLTLTVDHTASSCTDCVIAAATSSAEYGTDTDPGNSTDIQDPTSIQAPSDLRTTFLTSVDFSDDPNLTELTAKLVCNTGLPLMQTFEISEGSPVNFTVAELPFTTPGTRCEITLDDVANYDLYASANGGDPAASCVFEVVSTTENNFDLDASNICVFTADAEDATYTVSKVWVVPDRGFEEMDYDVAVEISCTRNITSASTGYYKAGSWSGELGHNESVTIRVDTLRGDAECTATEHPGQSGVESESSGACIDARLVAGGSASCEFTNTMFFEGIPTLSQYGLAVLALLMLSVGVVGFRRIV